MTHLTTRRNFIQQTAFAAAALSGSALSLPVGASPIFETPDQNATPPDPSAIRKLASQLTGRIITADSSEYESARLVFNRAFDQRPALIVRCGGASDVARALDFAQRHQLPLAVRGGGHSRAGFGVCVGGMVIDLSAMQQVTVDRNQRIARAEGGCLVRDLDQATTRLGLATTSGGCPTVGIAGYTLGGGEGVLMSKYGAACDNLVSAQMVTVDGRQVEASQTSNPDLFWAIRGGGGNFGVVTSFEYRLHPVTEVLSGTLAYSAGPDVLSMFARFVKTAPDEMNVIAEALPAQGGQRVLIHARYVGSARVGNDLLQPLRVPLKPLVDNMRNMSYLESQAGGFLPAPFAHFQTNLFLPDLTSAAVEVITTAINHAPPQFRVLIVPLYGAISRIAVSETAFPLRQPGYEVDMLGSWSTPTEEASAVHWVKALRDNLKPFGRGTYVNQLGETSEDLVRAAYGPNYARLVAIKQKFDPTNVLRFNQNIKPV